MKQTNLNQHQRLLNWPIPTALVVLGVILTFNFLKSYHFGLFSLEGRYQSQDFRLIKGDALSAGKQFGGAFTSRYPNLNSVSAKFETNGQAIQGQLLFRLKSTEAVGWYYQAKYPAEQIRNRQFFSFSFPTIHQSEGQSYYFEIESLAGAAESALTVNYPKDDLVLISGHKFSLGEINQSPRYFLHLIKQRLINLFFESDLLIRVGIYFLPVIFYLLFRLSKRWDRMLVAVWLVVLIDAWLMVNTYWWLWIAIIGIWGWLVWQFQLASSFSAATAVLTLLMAAVFLIFQNPEPAEKSGIWTYLFLAITAFHLIYESRLPNPQPFPLISLLAITKIDFRSLIKNFLWVSNLLLTDHLNQFKKVYVEDRFWKLVLLTRRIYLVVIYIGISGLMGLISYQLFKYYHFYQYFLQVETARKMFILNSSLYLSLLYFTAGTITLIWIIKLSWRKKILAGLVALFVVLWLGEVIFNFTSAKFRDNIYIFTISPQRATLWDEVIITGTNFKNLPWSSKILVAGMEHRILKWTNEEIIFQIEPGKSKSGEVQVVDINGRVNKNPVQIEVYDFFTKEAIK